MVIPARTYIQYIYPHISFYAHVIIIQDCYILRESYMKLQPHTMYFSLIMIKTHMEINCKLKLVVFSSRLGDSGGYVPRSHVGQSQVSSCVIAMQLEMFLYFIFLHLSLHSMTDAALLDSEPSAPHKQVCILYLIYSKIFLWLLYFHVYIVFVQCAYYALTSLIIDYSQNG